MSNFEKQHCRAISLSHYKQYKYGDKFMKARSQVASALVILGASITLWSMLALPAAADSVTVSPLMVPPSSVTPVPSLLYQSAAPVQLSADKLKQLEAAQARSNLPGPAVPVGSGPSALPSGPQSLLSPPTPQASSITFGKNNAVSPPGALMSSTNEPSVAQNGAGNVIFYTGNWYAAQSP